MLQDYLDVDYVLNFLGFHHHSFVSHRELLRTTSFYSWQEMVREHTSPEILPQPSYAHHVYPDSQECLQRLSRRYEAHVLVHSRQRYPYIRPPTASLGPQLGESLIPQLSQPAYLKLSEPTFCRNGSV